MGLWSTSTAVSEPPFAKHVNEQKSPLQDYCKIHQYTKEARLHLLRPLEAGAEQHSHPATLLRSSMQAFQQPFRGGKCASERRLLVQARSKAAGPCRLQLGTKTSTVPTSHACSAGRASSIGQTSQLLGKGRRPRDLRRGPSADGCDA